MEKFTILHPPPNLPLSEFNALLNPLGPFETAPHLAIALSGGSDSMALTLLAHDWAKARNGRITALTVDHGLRPESAQEGATLKQWCEALGITHCILRIQDSGFKIQGKIQEAAREARYGLLTDYCRQHNILHLLTAHQREDQTETFFFRLARGSGLMGLACMTNVSQRHGIRLLRPLLSVPKARLIATLQQRNHPWIEDPSNQKPIYTRNRIRALLAQSDNAESIHERTLRLIDYFAKFRALFETKMAEKMASCVSFGENGSTIDAPLFLALKREYGLGILAGIVQTIGGGEHKPRSEKLERFYISLCADIRAGNNTKRTFSRCLFHLKPKQEMILVKTER